MSKLKILIVEDEMIIANDMKLMLEGIGYDVCGIARSTEKALAVLTDNKPDLALVDINLQHEIDGIELGKMIRDQFYIPFIFCTSHSDNATVTRAKQVQANGYLLKPFTKDDLYVAIEMALVNFTDNSKQQREAILQDSIFVKDGKFFTKVKFEEITYVMQDRNYVEISAHGRKYPVRSTLKEFIQKLPPRKFFQVHRSFVVNVSFIKAVGNDTIRLNDGEIPISKNYRDELLSAIRVLS